MKERWRETAARYLGPFGKQLHAINRLVNPHGLTRLSLAGEIARGGATVGDHTYGTPRLRFKKMGHLHVGRFCSISNEVQIFLGGNHRTDFVSTYPFASKGWPASASAGNVGSSKGDVRIGSDVWIGSGVAILSGVTIGDGAVIGAGALVAKDVPAYSIAGGNPAKVLRLRFDPAQIERLLAVKWWDLPDAALTPLLSHLQSDDVEGALDAAERARAAL